SMVAHALDAQLQSQRLDLKADEVFINTYDTQAKEREERPPVASLSMVEHFIERLSIKTGPVPNVAGIGLYEKLDPRVALRLPSITVSRFNKVIDEGLKVFASHEMRELPRLFLSSLSNKHAHSLL
ncbi:hypothetical protein, partial [Klebsiella pneumoniae]